MFEGRGPENGLVFSSSPEDSSHGVPLPERGVAPLQAYLSSAPGYHPPSTGTTGGLVYVSIALFRRLVLMGDL